MKPSRSVGALALVVLAVSGCGGVVDARASTKPAPGDAGSPTPPSYPRGAIATLRSDGAGVLVFAPRTSVPEWSLTSDSVCPSGEVCRALAFDASGRLYVLVTPLSPGASDGRVTVFESGATGAAAPLRVVAPAAGLFPALMAGLAVDSAFRIVATSNEVRVLPGATEFLGGSLRIFEPDAGAGAVPSTVLGACSSTCVGVGIDRYGFVYVGNGESPVLVFSGNATGGDAPIRTLQNRGNMQALAVDPSGSVYVADWTGNAIFVYPPGFVGGDPARTLAGPTTRIVTPHGLAADADGRIYAAEPPTDAQPGRVLVFAPGASGDARPERVLSEGVQGDAVAVAP